MTKTISTLAALFLATSALSSAAEAGGVRLSFGGPLGSFTAHPTHSSGPGGTAKNYSHARSYAARNDHCEKPARRLAQQRAKVYAHKAPKIEVAEAPAVRKIRKPKVVIERPHREAPEVKTAKLVDKDVVSDAAPSITVPESPVAPVQVTGTQSSPSARTASLEPATVPAPAAVAPDAEPQAAAESTQAAATPAPAAVETAVTEPAKVEPVKAEAAKTEPAKKTAKETKGKSDAMVARICRRFSAAIAGLIDVPCE